MVSVIFVHTQSQTITIRRRRFFLFPITEVWCKGKAYWVNDGRYIPLKLTGKWVFPWYRENGQEAGPSLREKLNRIWSEYPTGPCPHTPTSPSR